MRGAISRFFEQVLDIVRHNTVGPPIVTIQIVTILLRIAVGLWLLFGAAGLRRLLHRARRLGTG